MNCPKCGSSNIQLTSHTTGKIKKRGCLMTLFHLCMIFFVWIWWILIALLTSGSKGKIKTIVVANCMECGYSANKKKFAKKK